MFKHFDTLVGWVESVGKVISKGSDGAPLCAFINGYNVKFIFHKFESTGFVYIGEIIVTSPGTLIGFRREVSPNDSLVSVLTRVADCVDLVYVDYDKNFNDFYNENY